VHNAVEDLPEVQVVLELVGWSVGAPMGRKARIGDKFDRSEEPERRALARRLQRQAGPLQVAELLRGTRSSDVDWRGWCNSVLAAMDDPMPKVREAAAEAGRLEARVDVCVSTCGTDGDEYWDGSSNEDGLWDWLLAREGVEQPNKGELDAILPPTSTLGTQPESF
jgi:hypothetical protein